MISSATVPLIIATIAPFTIEAIQTTTIDPFQSTMIFGALGSLGALENDAFDYVETVSNQIASILADEDNQTFWEEAAGIYYAQYDHPYDFAFSTAISNLNEVDKKNFFKMTVRGGYSSIFTGAILLETIQVLGESACNYLSKWVDPPWLRIILCRRTASLSLYYLT